MSFTSYLYSGADDFSILDDMKGDVIANPVPEFKNVCGFWGAKSAYFFLNDCFGLASYFVPVFLVMLALKLIGAFNIKMIRQFITQGICMIWISLFLGSPVISNLPLFKTSHIKPGGASGMFTDYTVTSYVGEPGLYQILILFAILILIYFSVNTIVVIRKALRMQYLKNRIHFGQGASEHGEEKTQAAPVVVPKVDECEYELTPSGVVDKNSGELVWIEDATRESGDKDSNVFGSGDGDLGHKTPAHPVQPETEENLPAGQDVKPAVDDTAALFDQIAQRASSTNHEDKPTSVDFSITESPKDSERVVNPDSPAKEEPTTPYDPHKDLEYYQRPPFSLLDHPDVSDAQIDMDEQKANKDRIIQVLHSFGVEISSIKATIGPTITLYEITPAEGMRISKIRNLEDDIALSLAAEGIRIIAPIPGKGTIGIEVPNKRKNIVSMDSVLESKKFQETTMELPCALGKTITNEVFMIDLAKAPHLLVAGATGMGKSVGLNAIVTSLLYKKHPSELKIVMVDPKKVEFSIYSPIENHFLAKLEDEDEPIITDVQHVVKTLNSLCQMMDHRYELLKRAQVRTIKEYNEKFKSRQLDPRVGHEFMPYFVVIIDEFGDLIMTAGKEIELPICRIAQLARAVGIHMIIATQRPTANIITGTIKANFPARIAFRVAAMMDSRVILDRPGANQLIGRGDMLYLQGGDPVRVQCAFIDTPEVSRICRYISTQQGYPHAAYLPEVVAESDEGGSGSDGDDLGRLDPMFAECARLIVSKQMGSTSLLQRQFSIGYNRAGRLMDQMEKAGVVGPQVGQKPREVLIQDFVSLDRLISSLMS
ncbi:MAG: DNA translocase FtsK [Bacteroidaceae bacterium]|nr:DNA translocase FtsK [Bacteroidaceae bacterium]